MDILLHPIDDQKLSNLYEKAISEAVELFIISAYLTEWNPTSKLNNKCEELTFIFNTDFGITRKAACFNVLRWLPKTMKNAFFAADRVSGFHPKLVAWKTKGGSYSLIMGSSNLTQAAFSTNY
jgi:hypothetical protein